MSHPNIIRVLHRVIDQQVKAKELAEMIFVSGPRQVGKTHLARELVHAYYNWDTAETKTAYLNNRYFFRSQEPWVAFDEIHKRKDWKKILKGYFDSPDRRENFFVTGSGRLDLFQKGGDSLQGRYDSFHLWPLSPDEIHGYNTPIAQPRNFPQWEPSSDAPSDLELRDLGGFPAPFLTGSKTRLQKWLNLYLDRLVREDIRDFSNVIRLDQIEMLARILPSRLSGPISLRSLAEDLDVSPIAVRHWLRLFEILFFGFQLKPYSRKIYRAVKREPKWYFFQWTYAQDAGARFENYLAVQLYSAISLWNDLGFGRYELFYLRDQDRREVDFLIAHNLQPVALVEAKASAQSFTSALHYYCQKLKIPGFLVFPEGPSRRVPNLGWCVNSRLFLQNLCGTANR